MKPYRIIDRVDNLSQKIVDRQGDYVVKLDVEQFTEAEQVLFQRVRELVEKYGDSMPLAVAEANKDLLKKANRIFIMYTLRTFSDHFLSVLPYSEDKLVRECFFDKLVEFLKKMMTEIPEIHKNSLRLEEELRAFEENERADAPKNHFENETESDEVDTNEHFDPLYYRNY